MTLLGLFVASCSSGPVELARDLDGNGGGGGNGASGGAPGNDGGPLIDPDGSTGDASCPGATTCAQAGVQCGPIGNGCGGILQCGDCAAPDTCGGGGVAGVCGHVPCKGKTCADLGINCGPAGDGCGAQLDCGTCSNGESCGGGGVPGKCGSGSTCTPKSCAEQAVDCGPVGDGCGGSLDCGSCTSPQTCGGGGISSVCGSAPCVPKTCNGLCGPVGDGCGGLMQCGSCNLPDTCGGQKPSECGIPSTCTNLCLQQVTCSNPAITTTVTGKVYAPNGVDPLLNALVYVPNAPVDPFPSGVSCDQCASEASGAPLVSAVSAVDGSFTLSNVPVGQNIPLVIQLGRWRRQVTIPNVVSCQNTAVPAALTRLPRKQSEGDIPLMAFSTGAVDALECVMRKIGVDESGATSSRASVVLPHWRGPSRATIRLRRSAARRA